MHQLNVKNQRDAKMQITTVNKDHDIEITTITQKLEVYEEKLKTSQKEIHELSTKLAESQFHDDVSLITGTIQKEFDQYKNQQVVKFNQFRTETNDHVKMQIAIDKTFADKNIARLQRKNRRYEKNLKVNRKLNKMSSQIAMLMSLNIDKIHGKTHRGNRQS